MQITSFSLLSIVLAFTASTSWSEQTTSDIPANVSFTSVTDLPIAAMGDKVTYGTADQQFMLHWQALGKPRGTLVFVHGGCWSNQFDLAHASAFAAQVAQLGYEVWSLEYRRSGDTDGGWPGSLRDIETAITHIARTRSAAPLVLAGHSAGGHLALLAGATQADKVDAVLGLAAIAQLGRYSRGTNSCQKMVTQFMGGSEETHADAYALADPAKRPFHPHTILLHGTADQIVPIEQTDIAGVTTRLVPGAGHFDWLHPQTEAFSVLMHTLAELSHER